MGPAGPYVDPTKQSPSAASGGVRRHNLAEQPIPRLSHAQAAVQYMNIHQLTHLYVKTISQATTSNTRIYTCHSGRLNVTAAVFDTKEPPTPHNGNGRPPA